VKHESPEVAAARLEAELARARLFASVRAFEAPLLDLKQQLTPSHIMGDAWDAAKSKGADLAEDAVDAVRARPFAATGVVAAITLFLAREPLMDLASNLFDGAKAKRAKKKSLKNKPDSMEAADDRSEKQDVASERKPVRRKRTPARNRSL
jgi:hypothetical protein